MKKLLLFSVLAISNFVQAQSGLNFLNLISASNGYYWMPSAACKLANGNYLIGEAAGLGMTIPQGGGLICSNTSGNIVWNKDYSNFQPEFITENGGNIFTVFNTNHSAYGISKHNATGTSVFAKTFLNNNPGFSGGPSPVNFFKEGSNLAVFYNENYSNGASTGLLSKIDANGNSVFSKRIDSLVFVNVAQYGSTYIILAIKNFNSYQNYYVLNVDASLNIVWSKELDFTQTLSLNGISIQNNNIYIPGNDQSNRLVLLGLDGNGNLILNKSYYSTTPGVNYFQANNVVYKSNHLYLFSIRNSNGNYYYSNLTTLNMNGTPVKDRQISFNLSSFYNKIVVNADTSVYSVGQMETSFNVTEAFQSHFNLSGDLGMCVADSINISDSSLTVSVSVPPTFSVTNEPIVFTNYSMVVFSSTAASVDNFKIQIDSLINTNPICSLPCSGDETVYFSGFDQNPVIQWSINSGNQNTQTASNLCAAIYTVTLTDQFGCTAVGTDTLKMTAPNVPQICMITTDSMSINNIIYYDKTAYTEADSFIVYREVSSGVYKWIGAVSYDSLSLFVDVNRSVGPANGDPNVGYYHYKLQMRDTCGNYSALSPYHTTVYFIDNQNGTFTWNTYDVEGGSTPVANFKLMRDSANIGDWHLVGSVAGTTTTLNDPTYSTYQFIANWRVDALTFNCSPTMRFGNNSSQSTITKSRSNIKSNRTTINGQLTAGSNQILVYPNPVNEILNIDFKTTNPQLHTAYNIQITDVLGNTVKQLITYNSSLIINITDLQNGVYCVKVNSNGNSFQQKIIVQH